MIKIAFCDVGDLNLFKSYRYLSERRLKKVGRYIFDKDKKLSAGAYLLLNKLLLEENIVHPIFKTEEFGKAYISNYKGIHFNLSHSERFVACAISDTEIGIDIEFNDPKIDLDIARNYFYNTEYESIMTSENPANEFFKYWVLKESYMKYTGLGFNLDLDSFEIVIEDDIKLKNDRDNLKFSLFDVDEYKLAVCSKYKAKNIEEYTANELLDF